MTQDATSRPNTFWAKARERAARRATRSIPPALLQIVPKKVHIVPEGADAGSEPFGKERLRSATSREPENSTISRGCARRLRSTSPGKHGSREDAGDDDEQENRCSV
jgi:hypothetical protein